MRTLLKTLLLIILPLTTVFAVDVANFPRAASLKKSEVNVRAGPGTRYPILWVFERKGWPVLLLTRFDNWYKIRDIEGEEGWVYLSMISSARTAVISHGEPAALYKKPDSPEKILRFENGVIVNLLTCAPTLCEVDYIGTEGWVEKNRLLTVHP